MPIMFSIKVTFHIPLVPLQIFLHMVLITTCNKIRFMIDVRPCIFLPSCSAGDGRFVTRWYMQ